MSVVDLSEAILRPSRVSAGDVRYPPEGHLGPRWQNDLELVLVHSGEAVIHVDGVARPVLGEGSVGLLLPGHREELSFASTGPTHHSWLRARLAESPPRLLAKFASLPPAIPASRGLTVLVREAVETVRSPVPRTSPLLGALATSAFWRYAEDAWSGSVHPSAVDGARVFIHKHAADPELDLHRIAAAVEVTGPHLVRRFRAELGITPMAYLWQQRIAAGIDLLVQTGLPVGDVAARSGFKSVYHFSRKIREHAGRAPTQVRREGWEEGWRASAGAAAQP